MTTMEKLAEVKREFARAGHEVDAILAEPVCWPGTKCRQCGERGLIFIGMKITLPVPEKPTGKGAKVIKKWQEKMDKWFKSGDFFYVCLDRPLCRLRRAKREYRKARLREKEQRRRERALRV